MELLRNILLTNFVFQLRICPMRRCRKGYIRSGDYIEVRVSKTSSYQQVVSQAIEVLGIEEEDGESEDGEPRIFRIDGTVVPDCPIDELSWTVSRYLRSLHKTAGQLKLGVGFHYRVSSSFCFINTSCKLNILPLRVVLFSVVTHPQHMAFSDHIYV